MRSGENTTSTLPSTHGQQREREQSQRACEPKIGGMAWECAKLGESQLELEF